jgi:hypothetical protein
MGCTKAFDVVHPITSRCFEYGIPSNEWNIYQLLSDFRYQFLMIYIGGN